MSKFKIRESYLLLLIVLGLVSLGIYTTYALFTASTTINDVVGITATLDIGKSLTEYEVVTVQPNETKLIELNVVNSYNGNIYYGAWYQIVKGNSDNIQIGLYTERNSNPGSGSLSSSSNINLLVGITNDNSTSVTLYIGVKGSLTNELNLGTSKTLIPDGFTEPLSVTVNITNGTINNSTISTIKVKKGNDATFNVTPNEGYQLGIDTQTCNGTLTGEGIFTISNITENKECNLTLKRNNLDTSGANTPDLVDGLIPVMYDGSKWVKADESNSNSTYQWYDYSNKLWANAVLVANNGPGIILDLSGNGNSGKIYGATVNSNGINISSDSSTYVELPDNIGVTLPATYSITFSTNSTENQVIFGDYNTQASLGLYNSNNEFIVALGQSNFSSQTYKFNTGGISINTTYTVDLVYHSLTDVDVYLNGNLLSKSTSTNYWSWDSGKSYIGKRPSGTSNFNGIVKKFIVYNDELTSSEINHNYNVNNLEVCNNGIICDNLKLYYNFTSSNSVQDTRSNYRNANPGTTITESDILAYYVWIPRYKYKVWNKNKVIGTDSYNAQTTGIDIVFENEKETTGTISCTYNYNVDTSNGGINLSTTTAETCTGSNGDYYTHPAFTFGSDNVRGLWISKFEISSSDPTAEYGGGKVTNLTVRSLPNVTSWRYNTANNFNTVIQNMQTSNNIYGLSTSRTNTDSHMITNMEWGSVAYLTNSKYGRCTNGSCTEITINNCTSYITGIGADRISDSGSSTSCTTAANKYNGAKGVLASTTGNITGVYDMSGGAWENVMGNISSVTTRYTFYPSNSGFSSSWYTTGTAKYVTTYANGSSYGDQMAYNRGRLGDATSEVVFSTKNGWYSDLAQFAYSAPSWLIRSGYAEIATTAGLFYFNGDYGAGGWSVSSHATLVSLSS